MQPHPWSVDKIDLTRSHTRLETNLDFYIISTMACQGLETQNREDTKSPQTWWYQIITKEKHGSNTAKKSVARTWPKNLTLNVEDHIASTPTRQGRKPIPCARSWSSVAYIGLLVETILLSNRVWDLVYPYRHMVVRNISLGERDYEPVLKWPRRVSPIGILSRHSCHDKLPP